jgi:DNA-binding HxlR family transcriptional regulator
VLGSEPAERSHACRCALAKTISKLPRPALTVAAGRIVRVGDRVQDHRAGIGQEGGHSRVERFLRDGPKRYGELKRLIQDVSDKVLIQQLKDLEADRVLARTDYKEVPPRVDYALTPLGRSLAEAIVPLCTWGTENAAEMARIFATRDSVASTSAPLSAIERQ